MVVENLVKLPEKWCVEITKDNYRMLGDYWNKQANKKCYEFKKGFMHSHNYSDQNILNGGKLDASFHNNVPKFEIVIFEDFKRLILKESQNIDIILW
jgi:hypothetical protein